MAGDKDRDRAPEKKPGADNSPGQGGYHHADTRMGHEHSEELADLEHMVTGSEKPPGRDGAEEADALSRSTPPRKK